MANRRPRRLGLLRPNKQLRELITQAEKRLRHPLSAWDPGPPEMKAADWKGEFIPELVMTPLKLKVLMVLGTRQHLGKPVLSVRELNKILGFNSTATLYGEWGVIPALRDFGLVGKPKEGKRCVHLHLTSLGMDLYYHVRSVTGEHFNDWASESCFPHNTPSQVVETDNEFPRE